MVKVFPKLLDKTIPVLDYPGWNRLVLPPSPHWQYHFVKQIQARYFKFDFGIVQVETYKNKIIYEFQ